MIGAGRKDADEERGMKPIWKVLINSAGGGSSTRLGDDMTAAVVHRV